MRPLPKLAASHMSACGTKLPKPVGAACPVLAKADTRPAYRADVSLARLSPWRRASRSKLTLTATRSCITASSISAPPTASSRVKVLWPDVQLYSGPGATLSAPSGSASKMLAALFPEQLKKVLTAGIVDVRGAIPAAERPQLIREVEARIFALEVGEERLVVAALAAGLEVHRRIDANSRAILFSDEEVAAGTGR